VLEPKHEDVTDKLMVILEGRSLWKSYGADEARVEALRDVDLQVRRGEFVAIMGPSGSGKSTLLNLLGGIELPDQGQILFSGSDLASFTDDQRTLFRRRELGFVFQHINLLPNLNALENVALPLLLDNIATAEAYRRAERALADVNASHRRMHWPGTLSGGEQQRVAIARAIVIQPKVILADEPTGALDSVNGDQIVGLLRTLVETYNLGLIMVTHDADIAARADRIVRLRDGQISNTEPADAPTLRSKAKESRT
jgi:putative ABC transport system ATP-binding protein